MSELRTRVTGGGAVFTGLVDFEMVGYAFLLCIALTIVIEEVTAHSKSLTHNTRGRGR